VTIVGLLLAGGQSRRMGGGDKTLRPIGGRLLLERVIERIRPQVDELILNANGDPERFTRFGLPVVADTIPDFAGPLAGILAGLDWAAENCPGCALIASVPADAPFLPDDLVARLLHGMESAGTEMVCAESCGQPHPVVGLWPVRLREELRRALTDEGLRKVDRWTARYRFATVAFDSAGETGPAIDPFFNANRPEDFATAEQLLGPAR